MGDDSGVDHDDTNEHADDYVDHDDDTDSYVLFTHRIIFMLSLIIIMRHVSSS